MAGYSETLEAGFSKTVDSPFEEVLRKTEEALEREGFGILTRIDVSEAMRQKLGVEFPPYQILGACKPPLAHRALSAEPRVGLMLPCNVVVRQVGQSQVAIDVVNAEAMARIFPDVDLTEVAASVNESLGRVLESVG